MRTAIVFALTLATSLTLTLGAGSADAGSPEECAPSYSMDPLKLLRQASLDLRGQPPTIEEYEVVRAAADRQATVDAMIAEMLVADDFYVQIRDYHRDLLWSNVSEDISRIFPNTRQLAAGGNGALAASQGFVREKYRGDPQLFCLDQEQTEFDGEGRPIPISTFPCMLGTCQQDGWVMVEPYWAPGVPTKVCAFEAQTTAIGIEGKNCNDIRVFDPGCGCGADLQQCTTPEIRDVMRADLSDEPARLFESVVRNGASYLDAFRAAETQMNGPVVHFYRHMLALPSQNVSDFPFEADLGNLPNLPYTNANWTTVTRGPAHAGAFTTLAYMMRFASLRGRANRFYTAFYCSPFVPSIDGLPPEGADPSPDLRQRDGCSSCHQILEPAAAHFARWRINSSYGLLTEDLLDFDVINPTCLCGEGTSKPVCTEYCSQYYVTADNSEAETYELFGGLPLTVAYASPTELANGEAGPAVLVDSPEDQRAVAECAVKTMAEHLLHRPLESTELDWVSAKSDEFIGSGYDFAAMVASLIADERYRTIH